MRDGGKGDKPRPFTDKEQFDKNWDEIFNKNLNKEKEKNIEVSLDIENDSQEVTVTKTWKF